MKTLTILILLVISGAYGLNAQAVDWSLSSSGSGSDVCTDNFGNNFHCAQIVGSVVMGSNTLTSNGLQDGIVAKYGPSGNLIWAISFGGPQGDYANKITYDNQGAVWVTGQFAGTLTAGAFTLTSAGGTDAYLIKISAVNGAILYAEKGGSTGNDVGMAVEAASNGTIYWSGTYTSSFTYGTASLTGSGMDVFLLKLNNNGTPVWSQNVTGSSIETMWTMNIDAAGNAYVGGFATSGNTSFAGSTSVSMSPSTHFVAKFDNLGNYVWSALGDFNGEIYGVCTDPSGNVYFTGNFDTQITLGAITLTNSGPNDDIMVVKINPAGQYCWAKNFGNTGSDQGYDMVCDGASNLFLTGSFQTAFSFGGVNVNGGGSGMAFVSKLDSAGTVAWVVQANSANLTYFKGICRYGTDDIYACGIGSGNVTLGNSVITPSGGFITKIADHANIIEGTVFRDLNNDGLLGTGETGVPNTIMQLNAGPYVSSSNNNGIYQLFTAAGTYSSSIPNLPLYHTLSTPAVQTATFTGMGNIDTANHFGLYPAPNVNDLRVVVTPVTRPKAGFVLQYMITCTNIGTTTQNASVAFTADPILGYLQASPAATSQTGQTATWNIGSLAPQAIATISVLYTVPTSAIIGDSIQSQAVISPVTNDTVPGDNTENNLCFVVGPWDPNFKEVTDSTLTLAELALTPWLTYTVHFQNVGNDSANTVIIRDSLSQQLDWSSMEIVANSHAMNFLIAADGKTEFRFDNIMLPDSMTNPVTSCGFVKYRIKPLTTLVAGDSIPNYADIYFDYNPPITTDLVTTYIVSPAGIQEVSENNLFSVFPIPSDGHFQIQLAEPAASEIYLTVYSQTGQKVWEKNRESANEFSINLSGLPNGYYLLRIQQGAAVHSRGVIIRK